MDYTYWKRPAEFRPENFTDSDGDLIHHEAFLPYGLGEWFSCMGIIVANQRTLKYTTLSNSGELFAYTTDRGYIQ